MTATVPTPSRPGMPDGYGIAKDSEGLLPWSHALERLERSRNYWICTTRPHGRPHAMPVWGVVVDGRVHFGTSDESVKARNLAANPQVTVHLESGDDCVIVEGTAEQLTGADPDRLDRIRSAYGEKYPGFAPEPDRVAGFWAVKPRVAFAWLESDYPRTATRFNFD
jgi:hypothetical protein